MLPSLVFLPQILEGDQAIIIFSSLLYYFISLYQSFYVILCSLLLLSAISHSWIGEAASVKKNQFYLQWFSWWSIIRCLYKKILWTWASNKFSFVLMVTVCDFIRDSNVFMRLMVRPFLRSTSDSVSIRDPRHFHFFHKSF